MGDIYKNSNDEVLFGTTSHFFVKKFKGLKFEIRSQTNIGSNSSLVESSNLFLNFV